LESTLDIYRLKLSLWLPFLPPLFLSDRESAQWNEVHKSGDTSTDSTVKDSCRTQSKSA